MSAQSAPRGCGSSAGGSAGQTEHGQKRAPGRPHRPKVGLALGGGAARGMAHIGVLHALAEAGITPDIVAGTSIGSLVGGFYAAGKLDELTEIVTGLDWKQAAYYFMELPFHRSGLIEGLKVTQFLGKIVGKCDIRDLPIAFRAVATEITSGREVILDSGDLVSAIRASIAVPGIFTPARRHGELLVDGGLVNPVPVSVCRALGAEQIIAVDLNHGRISYKRASASSARAGADDPAQTADAHARKMIAWLDQRSKRLDVGFLGSVKSWVNRQPEPSIFDVLGNSVCIMEGQIAATRLKIDCPDILVRPNIGHIRFLEFHLASEVIDEGYRAAREALARQGTGRGEKDGPGPGLADGRE